MSFSANVRHREFTARILAPQEAEYRPNPHVTGRVGVLADLDLHEKP